MKNALLLLVVACLVACEPPPVFAGADKRQNTMSARIEGNVVVTTTARGNVVLFLYDAARPPPPVGTGRPLTFTVVPRELVFGDAPDGDPGPFTAPYAFSLVGAGRYLVRGFVDGNSDFIPWYGVTADVNAGDVGGGAVDPVTRAMRTIEVALDDREHPVAVVDVPVSFSDAARVPFDRPAFAVAGGAPTVTVSGMQQEVELQAQAISEGVVQQGLPTFLARLVDDNGDGMPDDANGDGTPDFWPRVVVRKVTLENPLIDENDKDKNGVLDTDPGFADYEHVNPANGATIPADGKPDAVVLAAGFNFTELLPQLVDGMGRVKATPTPVNRLKLVLKPLAVDASNPAQLQPLKALPSGRYAITVIQSTGQTWRVPNELMPGIADRVGLPTVASQAFLVTVP